MLTWVPAISCNSSLRLAHHLVEVGSALVLTSLLLDMVFDDRIQMTLQPQLRFNQAPTPILKHRRSAMIGGTRGPIISF